MRILFRMTKFSCTEYIFHYGNENKLNFFCIMMQTIFFVHYRDENENVCIVVVIKLRIFFSIVVQVIRRIYFVITVMKSIIFALQKL